MFDDWDIISFCLIGISAGAAIAALWFYRRDPLCLWRTPPDTGWAGKGFDPNLVSTRLAQVRKDYVAAHHRNPPPRFHAALLERAATMVKSCAYWHHAAEHEEDATGIPRHRAQKPSLP